MCGKTFCTCCRPKNTNNVQYIIPHGGPVPGFGVYFVPYSASNKK